MASDTRNGILRIARTLFVRQGYAATSLRQVARRAGVAKATIYHHFHDKRAIMSELLREAQAQMEETLRALAHEEDPLARLQTAAKRALRFLGGFADLMQIARREVPGSRERIGGEVGQFLHECEKLIMDAIAQGRRQGIFRSVLPQKAARVFMIMLQGSFANAMFSGEKPPSSQKAAAVLLDVFFNGISARPGREGS